MAGLASCDIRELGGNNSNEDFASDIFSGMWRVGKIQIQIQKVTSSRVWGAGVWPMCIPLGYRAGLVLTGLIPQTALADGVLTVLIT